MRDPLNDARLAAGEGIEVWRIPAMQRGIIKEEAKAMNDEIQPMITELRKKNEELLKEGACLDEVAAELVKSLRDRRMALVSEMSAILRATKDAKEGLDGLERLKELAETLERLKTLYDGGITNILTALSGKAT